MTGDSISPDEEISSSMQFPPQVGQVVNGYQLEECLKHNNFCVVHVCHHISDNTTKYVTKVAIKWEANKLSKEVDCYKKLSGGVGIPELVFNKSWTCPTAVKTEQWADIKWTMIVIEKLVPKFSRTTNRFCKSKLTLEELVPMAVQQISVLEFVHNKGYVHKGIKPDNFVVSEDGSKVYLIDFNKSKPYLDSDGHHIPLQVDEKTPKGLPLFHSLNYHKGIRCSRRDDMESLGYCWIYWLTGQLPWSEISRPKRTWNQYVADIHNCLEKTTLDQLCQVSELPPNAKQNFIKYFELCRALNFMEQPNYESMRRLILNSLPDQTPERKSEQ